MENNPLRAVDIKQHNQNIILSYIHAARNSGGISQSELVSRTGLKAPSVFRIFSSLEENGFIRPCDGQTAASSEIKKGRRPSYFTVCPDVCYTIGLEFWAACISLGVFNFNGERIHSALFNLPKDFDAEHVVEKIVLMVNSAIELLDLPREKVIGIGVAAPGKVNVATGRVVFYNRIPGMQDFPLKEMLEKKLGIEVILHNNCSAIAYNVYKYRNPESCESLFSFLIRSGVNGALVSNGHIYVTSDHTTMEAGHMPINFEGPECSCGIHGCLQTYIFELDKEYSASSDNLSLFANLEEPLKKGDAKAQQIIEKAAFYLYTGMKSIVRFLAPEAFMLIGTNKTVSEALCESVRGLFAREQDNFLPTKPQIYSLVYDNLLAQQGASDLVLNQFFNA